MRANHAGAKPASSIPVMLALRRLRSGDSRVSQSHPNLENSLSAPGKDASRKLLGSIVSASRNGTRLVTAIRFRNARRNLPRRRFLMLSTKRGEVAGQSRTTTGPYNGDYCYDELLIPECES
jgi:hypothetical protein